MSFTKNSAIGAPHEGAPPPAAYPPQPSYPYPAQHAPPPAAYPPQPYPAPYPAPVPAAPYPAPYPAPGGGVMDAGELTLTLEFAQGLKDKDTFGRQVSVEH